MASDFPETADAAEAVDADDRDRVAAASGAAPTPAATDSVAVEAGGADGPSAASEALTADQRVERVRIGARIGTGGDGGRPEAAADALMDVAVSGVPAARASKLFNPLNARRASEPLPLPLPPPPPPPPPPLPLPPPPPMPLPLKPSILMAGCVLFARALESARRSVCF